MRKREWVWIGGAAVLFAFWLEARDPQHGINHDARRVAAELKEALPPSAYFEHPLARATYVEQSYRKSNGERVVVRRYTTAADLTERK